MVVEYAFELPASVQYRTSNELRSMGVFVSGTGLSSRAKDMGYAVAFTGLTTAAISWLAILREEFFW
jgi:hypothetical protein